MGVSTNGDNCKHEKIITFSTDHDGGIGYGCDNKDCGLAFNENEVAILTKAQHQAREGVVKAARKKRKLYHKWENMKYEGETDNKFLIFTDKKDAVWDEFKAELEKLDKALDALDKGERDG